MGGLPAWLTVAALKRRIDVELPKKESLLEEYLIGALEQAQEAPPLGCGRLLEPNPVLDPDDADTADPVEMDVTVTNRRVIIPDARELTAVTVNGEPITGYRTMRNKGMIVLVEFPRPVCERFGWRWNSIEAPPQHRLPNPPEAVTFTGRFGFLTAPMALKEAIYTLAARRFYESAAEYADTVKVAEGATASVYFKQLPPSVAAAFASFALPDAITGMS